MFGNTKGWGISSIIAATVAALIYFMSKPPQMTPPTGTIPLALASAALKVDPASLDIKSAGKDCDAQDFYKQVIDDYKENHFSFEKYDQVLTLEKEKPSFLGWIADAADCGKATMFGRKPDQLINYENSHDSLEALKKTGGWANSLGFLLITRTIKNKGSDFDQANSYLKGAFVLGKRLYDDRLRWEEYSVGTELMSNAAAAFEKEARYKNDNTRADQLAAFENTVKEYNTAILPAWKVISGIGIEGETLNNSGDMFDIAQHGKETMWRVEATLKLGRMAYMNNVTSPDQRGARRVLHQLANDDSLPVRTAANQGYNLTVDTFRKFGG